MAEREITVRLRVTSSGLEVLDSAGAKIGEVERRAASAGQGIGSAFSHAQASLITFNQAADLLVRALHLGASALQAVVGRIQELDQISDTAKSVGLTARELSSLSVAAEHAGLNIQAMVPGLSFFARQLAEAQSGTGKMSDLFRQLGINTQSGLLPALEDLGKALDRMEDGPKKVALAYELLGRNGTQALSAINAGLAESIRQAERFGLVVSEEDEQRFQIAADALDDLTLALRGLGNAAAREATPFVTGLAVELTELLEISNRLVRTDVPSWFSQIRTEALEGIPILGDFIAVYNRIAGAGRQALAERPVAAGSATGRRALDELFAGQSAYDTPPAVGGGGRPDRAGARSQERAEAERLRALDDANKQAQEIALGQEKASLAVLERQVQLREQSIDFAQQDLELAQQSGASMQVQLGLAERIDRLEIERLEAVQARIRAELDRPSFTPEDVARAEELNTQLDLTTRELERVKAGFGSVTDEIRRANDVTIQFGATINDSIKRVVDGILAGGGGFNIGDIVKKTLQTGISSVAGGFLQALFQGGDLEIKGLGKLEQVSQKFAGVIDRVVGLFGGTGGLASDRPLVPASNAPGAPLVPAGSGVGAFGSFTNLFGARNIGAGGVAPTTGQNVIGAIPIIGSIITAAFAVAQGAKEGLKMANEQRWQRGVTSGDLLGTAFSQDPVGQLWGGLLGNEIGGRVHAALLSGGFSELLALAGAFAPKTGGSIVRKEIQDWFEATDLPRQRQYAFGGRNELRVPGLEIAPSYAALFEQYGYPRRTPLEAAAPGTFNAVLGERLRAEGAARPSVEALRATEALGLAAVVFGKNIEDVEPAAQAMVNNFLLLGLSVEEAHRELLKLAQTAGVTLIGGLETLNIAFIKGGAGAQDLARLQSAAAGLVQLFTQDLPEELDVAAIVARRTGAAGIDIAGVQGDIMRAGIALNLRDQVEQIRFQNQSVVQQERQRRRELAELDAKLAATGLSDTKRQQLLQERAQIGLDLVSIAEQRYTPGTAQQRRAVERGLAIVEDTAQQLEDIGAAVGEPVKANTDATAANTVALNENTAALKGVSSGKLDINITGASPELEIGALHNIVRKMVDDALKGPKFKAAQKLNTFNR